MKKNGRVPIHPRPNSPVIHLAEGGYHLEVRVMNSFKIVRGMLQGGALEVFALLVGIARATAGSKTKN